MVAACNRKSGKELAPWVRSVSNHMWWSCATAKGDATVNEFTHIYLQNYTSLRILKGF